MKDIYSALYASKLVSYAQGFAVLQKASETYGWDLDLASIARMWRGGCIIRSVFLNDIAAAFEASQKPKHLLLAPYFREEIKELLRKQPLTPADIASQIEADKEIISQCIRELLEDEDLKAENGIISLKA